MTRRLHLISLTNPKNGVRERIPHQATHPPCYSSNLMCKANKHPAKSSLAAHHLKTMHYQSQMQHIIDITAIIAGNRFPDLHLFASIFIRTRARSHTNVLMWAAAAALASIAT
jgi:hypothetical protein